MIRHVQNDLWHFACHLGGFLICLGNGNYEQRERGQVPVLSDKWKVLFQNAVWLDFLHPGSCVPHPENDKYSQRQCVQVQVFSDELIGQVLGDS